MSVNIHVNLIPPAVRSRLSRDGHKHINLRTIKDILDYILFTFACKIYVNSLDNAIMELRLEDLDTHYTRQLSHGMVTEEKNLYERGIVQGLIWLVSNRPSTYLDHTHGDNVFTELFGPLDRNKLQNLKDSLSLCSSFNATTDSFNYDGILIKIEMAKRLITYCEMILGINQPQLEPSVAVPIPPDLTSYPPTPTSFTSIRPSVVPFELIDDTIVDTPGIDGQTFTIDLSRDGTSNPPVNDIIWYRAGIAEEYGDEFVDFIEDQIEETLTEINHMDLMDWLRFYRESRENHHTAATEGDIATISTPTITANEEEDLPY